MNQEVIISMADFVRLKQMIRQMRGSGGRGAYVNGLERELRRAMVVPVDAVPADTVTMNSCIRIRDVEANVRDTVTVVYPNQADGDERHVPVVMPLGTALLGMRVGDVIRHQAGSGMGAWQVEAVLYQPEAAGDHHL